MQNNDILTALLKEKSEVEAELSKLSRKDLNDTYSIDAKFKDLGSEEDDSVEEVAQYEVDTTIVGELNERLAQINVKLEELGYGKPESNN